MGECIADGSIAPVAAVEMSAVKVDSLGSQMHGYFAKPQREGKFPVLVMYQGARLKKRLNRLGRIFHYPVFKGPASL